MAGGGRSLRPAPDVVSDLWSWGGRFEYYYRTGAFEPRLRLEGYAAPQGDYFGGGAGVRFTALGSLWDADIGLWRAPSGTEFQFGISLFLPFGPDLALRANAGRYGPDPLLETPAAGSAAAIASWTVTRFSEPEPALYRIQPGSPALVTFRLESGEASRVEITGGFTDWEPRPMQRTDETWLLTLPVEPGVYHFGFLVNGEWHLPAEADGRIIDAWGVEHATLVVPEP
jgi:hypothetical protein